MTPVPDAERATATRIRHDLRSWYLASRRDLPWRRSSDPYAVWVSEVMLQQTTVASASGRWERFLKRFPSLEALARASETEVLAEWTGLGYYARARRLHAAARQIGRASLFPRTAAELQALPGVGRYTAAAVASIAFGERVAAIDTNAERVLSRLLGVAAETREIREIRGAGQAVRSFADRLLPSRKAGDHNQALMELGATVCLPAAPRCPTCPLRRHCVSGRSGAPPPRTAVRRPPPTRVRVAAGVAWRRGRLVVVRDAEMVRGHWTLPGIRCGAMDNAARVLSAAWPTLTGRETAGLRSMGRLTHAVLDRRYTVDVFEVDEAPGPRAVPQGCRLVREADVPRLERGSFLEKALGVSGGGVSRPALAAATPSAPARPPRRGARPTQRGG